MTEQMTLPELNRFLRVMLNTIETEIQDEGFTNPTTRLLDIRTEILQDLLRVQLEDFNRD